jgi:hypothetical protein
MSVEPPLPHPLFCDPCPHRLADMSLCPGFAAASSSGAKRALVRCAHFVIEVTPAGPVPSCTSLADERDGDE